MPAQTSQIGSARGRHLRRVLEAERDRLAFAMRSQRHELQTIGETECESVRDDIDVSDADIEDDLGFTFLELRSKTITEIDEALARLDRGEYGRCVDCGRDIAVRRLEALPFAACCVACELEREDILSELLPLSSAYSGEDRVSGLD